MNILNTIKIIKGWGLAYGNQVLVPLFHTKKEAKKKRFVEDIVKLEIRIIKREPLIKPSPTKSPTSKNY